MKVKRIVFIVLLIGLFAGCYIYMESKFDPLARYQATTAEERRVIIEYLNDEEIEYIISQKIKPEQFLPFIRIQGFEVRNTIYYDACIKSQPVEPAYIIQFVNMYKEHFNRFEFSDALKNYGYETLASYYVNGYTYIEEKEKLVSNPTALDLVLDKNSIVYRYVPKDLVVADNAMIPNVSNIEGETSIHYRNELNAPLIEMLQALGETNGKTNGDLILVRGYVSFDQQIQIYNKTLLLYGADQVKFHEDFPGMSETQLGLTLSFTIPQVESEKIEEAQQVTWLNDNAYKYGFIVRYPKDKESKTNKIYQPLTLRYVGKETAKKVYDSKKTLDEVVEKE